MEEDIAVIKMLLSEKPVKSGLNPGGGGAVEPWPWFPW